MAARYGLMLWLCVVVSATSPAWAGEGCNRIQLLGSHADAAGTRLRLVSEAGTRIDAAYFIFSDDMAGMGGLWFLREAARRGVQVRLIVDGQWNGISRAMIHHLIAEGIEVRCYHKFTLQRPLRITRRMHDKLLVVDQVHLVTGGRNIEDAYFGIGEKTYIDMDVYLQGPAAGDAARYFQELWDSDRVDPPSRFRVTRRAIRRAARTLDGLGAVIKAFPDEMHEMLYGADDEPSLEDDARFIYDPLGEERKKGGIRTDLLDLVRETQDEIIVETPYLVLTPGTRRLLEVGLARGVRIRILTNSLHATDNLYAQAGYLGMRRKLAGMGVELWEYLGPETLHAKAAVIDGGITVIGSYNVDPRSERLNTEVAVVVRNEELAARVRARMDSRMTHARRVDLSKDAPSPTAGLKPCKRLKLQLIRLILPLIYDQL